MSSMDHSTNVDHINSVSFKFLLAWPLLALLLPRVGTATAGHVLAAAAVVALASYPADLMLLPRTGNLAASLADWMWAALVLSALQWVLPGYRLPAAGALAAGAGIAAGELVFHRWYMRRQLNPVVVGRRRKPRERE